MDPTRFDALARSLVSGGTRRRLLAVLAALPLGGTLLELAEDEAAAERPRDRMKRRNQQRNRRQRNTKHNKNRNKKNNNTKKGGKGGANPGSCTPKGGACQQNSDCCGGNCFNQVCAALVSQCGGAGCPVGATGCCSGTCCASPTNQCNALGECCAPNCGGKQCGPDGCGNTGACGSCQRGQTCDAATGQCMGAACNPESCPEGCCDGESCRPGNTTQDCGTGGAPCTRCGTGQACAANGQCQCTGQCPNNAPCCRHGCAEEYADVCCTEGHGPDSGFCQFNLPMCCAPGLGGPGRCCPNGAKCCPPGLGDADGCCFSETQCSARTGPHPSGCCPIDEVCDGEKQECCPNPRDCCTDGSCCESGRCCGDTCCTDGQTCEQNTCVCNATSCPHGCCDGATCRDGGSNDHCGSDGVACAACTGRQVCGKIGPPDRQVCCFPVGTSGVCNDENWQTVCCLDPVSGDGGCNVTTGTCLDG